MQPCAPAKIGFPPLVLVLILVLLRRVFAIATLGVYLYMDIIKV